MTYCIGIDGGGTKTLGVLTDLAGSVLTSATVGATNPNDITPEASADRLTELCHTLLEQAGLTRDALRESSLFFGIAGGINHGPTLERLLGDRLTAAALRVRSDAHILLSGEVPTGDGACIICGTGSVCFLRRGEEIHRIGGWGYLLDSGGSGYDIGRDALEAALRAFDGRGEPTLLTDLLTTRDRLKGLCKGLVDLSRFFIQIAALGRGEACRAPHQGKGKQQQKYQKAAHLSTQTFR